MGLTTFKENQPTLKEVVVAKNYLSEKELRAMGQLVSGYLDFTERQAEHRELRSHVTSRQVIIFILVPNTARPVRYHQIKNELVFAFARHGRKPPARR